MNVHDHNELQFKSTHKRLNSQLLFKKSLIASLLVFIVLFTIFRRIPQGKFKQRKIIINGITTIDIPVTTQGGIPRLPTLPDVPLPVEDEYVPADETIQDTDLELYEEIVRLEKYGEGSGAVEIRPRPIKDVIPEYPEKERRQGITCEVVVNLLVNSRGFVDSVEVISNTTDNMNFIRAAKKAAYQTKYLPARYNNENFARWIKRKYTWK